MSRIVTFILALFMVSVPTYTYAHMRQESRTSPLPMQEVATIADFEVRVMSSTPNANDLVMAENQFNDPPATGHQFFIARVEVHYVGDETGDPAWDLSFQAVGDRGRGYTTFDNSCGVYPENDYSVGEMFPDAVAEMNVCWEVATSDVDSLVMYVEPLFSFDDERVWFSLVDVGYDGQTAEAGLTSTPETPETTNDETPSSVTRTSRTGSVTSSNEDEATSRESPLPVGEVAIVGDFEVRVVSVTPDASNVVLSANQFNDPPAAGNQFYIVRVEVRYQGDETGDPAWDLNFQSVGDLGRGYTTFDNSCGSYPDQDYDVGEMFPNATAEMNVCWEVASSDVGSLVMYVEPLFSFDDERVWFSLEP